MTDDTNCRRYTLRNEILEELGKVMHGCKPSIQARGLQTAGQSGLLRKTLFPKRKDGRSKTKDYDHQKQT